MKYLEDLYTITSTLFENDYTIIYKAVSVEDGKLVILKSHKHSEDTGKIRHEYNLLWGKNISGIANVIGLIDNETDPLYLVSEDQGRMVLETWLRDNKPDTGKLTDIIISAARSLQMIHDEGIIHRDIKPANMLIDADTLEISFIDFGISSISDNGKEGGGRIFAGTLEYMPPEQTGRLGYLVDGRSDLYSLGVVLYRTASGMLPFTGKNAMEYIHAHIAVAPRPLTELCDIHPLLSKVILKLLEKKPDNRYQSADSLLHDALNFKQRYIKDGDNTDFVLGEQDIFLKLSTDKKLYGREQAVRELSDLIAGISKENLDVAILSGEAGVGKTTILSHIRDRMEERHSIVFEFLFEEGDLKDPYQIVSRAYANFEKKIYKSKVPLSYFRDQLIDQMGESLDILCTLIPSLRSLLGRKEQKNIVTTSMQVEQAYSRFIHILSTSPVPVIFIIENIQWAGDAGFRLLYAGMENQDLGNVLVILTHRDEDRKNLNVMQEFLEKKRSRRFRVTQIQVNPLTVDEVAMIIDDVLPQEEENVEKLAKLAYDFSQGNITSLTVYLKELYRSKALKYDEETQQWKWDESFADTVAESDIDEYILELYKSLEKETRYMLLLLACIGRSISKEQFQAAMGTNPKYTVGQARELLRPALNLNLIQAGEGEVFCQFVSNAIPRTILSIVSEDERNKAHYQVGRTTYDYFRGDMEKLLQYCPLLTEQFLSLHRSGSKIPEEDRQYMIELNNKAGNAAMESMNHERALGYYNVVKEFLPENALEVEYETTFSFLLHYASALFLSNRREESIDVFNMLFKYARDEEDRYLAYRSLIKRFHAVSDWGSTQVYARRYLDYSGFSMQDAQQGIEEREGELRTKAYHLYYQKSNHSSAFIVECTDKALCRQGSMLSILAEAIYMQGDLHARYYVYLSVVFLLENGSYPDCELTLATVVGQSTWDGKIEFANTIFKSSMAYIKRKKLKQSPLLAVYCTMLVHWVEPLSSLPGIYREAKNVTLLEGNPYYASFIDMLWLEYAFYTNIPLKQLNVDVEAALYNAEKYQLNRFKLIYGSGFRQFIRCLRGKTIGAHSFEDRLFSEEEMIQNSNYVDWKFNANIYYVFRMKSLFLDGRFEEVIEQANKLELMMNSKEGWVPFLYIIDFHFYKAMAYIRIAEEKNNLEEIMPLMKVNIKALEYWAGIQPMNFKAKLDTVFISMQRIRTQSLEIVREFSRIYELCDALNDDWGKGILEESMAIFWKDRGLEHYSESHYKNAIHIYDRLGAKLKVYQMMGENLNDYEDEELISTTIYSYSDFLSSSLSSSDTLDYQTILSVIDSLARERSLEKMMNELLNILIKNGGAEYALLFLVEDNVTNLRAFRYSSKERSILMVQDLPVPLDRIGEKEMPKKLIELAIQQKKKQYALNSDNEYMFLGDLYLEQFRPESFLVLPIETAGTFFGAVYLENAKLPGVFEIERENFLSAIVTQAAILLQNAINMEAMEKYTENLERRLNSHLKQLNTLIAGIAHEVNSPLGVCVTIASGLLERINDVSMLYKEHNLDIQTLENYLEESERVSQVLLNNITRASEQMKSFKKIAVDQSNIVFERLNLMKVLSDIWEYVRPAVKKQISDCKINGPSNITINTSNGALAQVFTNLILNSAIHGFDGRKKEECLITIQVEEQEKDVVIVYQDNGRGMSSEESEQVFLPFYTTKRGEGGSGLGGHIILSLVTQTLNGSIQCTSRPEAGAVFTMRIPKNLNKEGSLYGK